MHHTALARAFRRILASSMPVSGGTLLVSCGSATDLLSTGAQVDGASGKDGSGTVHPSEDATVADGDGRDGLGDPSTVDAYGTPDSSGGDEATPIDAPGDETSALADASSDGDATVTCWRIVPLKDGALNSIDAGDGGLIGVECAALCGPGLWISCQLVEVGAAQCVFPGPCVPGRRPAGLLAPPPTLGSMLGAYLAEMARLEAASVHAFRRLRCELVAHRAPRRLIRGAERATRDEIRHTRMTRALAARYGGVVSDPRIEPWPNRDLEAIAIENAVEGCAGEAFGALVAHWQAVAASDPVIRAAMARIARDETRHAALGFEVDAWLRGRLGEAARARVTTARQQALEALASTAAEAPAALRSKLGLPTRAQSRLLVEQLTRIAA